MQCDDTCQHFNAKQNIDDLERWLHGLEEALCFSSQLLSASTSAVSTVHTNKPLSSVVTSTEEEWQMMCAFEGL